MSGFRLPRGGGAIDRDRPIGFRFNGRRLTGFAGDTLASALLANGVSIVGRSFKYHRPRGIVGSGFSETNALVQIGRDDRLVPNVPATLAPLSEGLEARSATGWPSVTFDLGRINDRLSALLGAGFYYKTFLWPHWGLFEPFIRRAAGIGRAPAMPDPDRYEASERDVDVLVIGAGPSGIAAARAASEQGAGVLLIDADEAAGPLPASVDVLGRTTALGYYDGNFVTAVEAVDRPGLRQRLWKLRARRVVIATGAFERPLLFENNDLPGIMLASAVRDYVERFGVAPGRAPLVATADDGGYETAFLLYDAGIPLRGIVDERAAQSALAAEAGRRGIPLYATSRIGRAAGSRHVRAAMIEGPQGSRTIDCDCIAMAGGWSPAVQLFSQSGGSTRYDPGIAAFVPDRPAQSTHICGAAAGLIDREAAVASGHLAGLAAARGDTPAPANAAPRSGRRPPNMPGKPKHVFIDMQTDVTLADLHQATRENYRSVEHVKRYTVWGMGVDQGRLSAANGVAALAAIRDVDPASLGTTRHRPPFAPVAIGSLAADRPNGALFRPWQRLPAHDWHAARGAEFEDFGYLRPSHYPLPGEKMSAAAQREARAVRSGVGIMDSSSFGKIELKGPEAGPFLDLISLGRPSTIPVGRVRYNLLCDEVGVLLDDGVVSRLADDHFLLNASSAHAARVRGWIEDWHQCQWPLNFVTRDVSEEWAVLTVAGPKARDLLVAAGCTLPLSREDFPHLSIRETRIGGHDIRLQRVSFTGELSYEIGIAAPAAIELAERLWEAGEAFRPTPFGLEALEILRIEKGFIHIGTDTDGTTIPADIGWGKIGRRDGDYLGKRSLLHHRATRAGRHQLVGLDAIEEAPAPFPVGGHIIAGTPHSSQGFVTSSCFSPHLDRPIALAMLADGRKRHGETVTIWSEGRKRQARVTSPKFFDPEGSRIDA